MNRNARRSLIARIIKKTVRESYYECKIYYESVQEEICVYGVLVDKQSKIYL